MYKSFFSKVLIGCVFFTRNNCTSSNNKFDLFQNLKYAYYTEYGMADEQSCVLEDEQLHILENKQPCVLKDEKYLVLKLFLILINLKKEFTNIKTISTDLIEQKIHHSVIYYGKNPIYPCINTYLQHNKIAHCIFQYYFIINYIQTDYYKNSKQWLLKSKRKLLNGLPIDFLLTTFYQNCNILYVQTINLVSCLSKIVTGNILKNDYMKYVAIGDTFHRDWCMIDLVEIVSICVDETKWKCVGVFVKMTDCEIGFAEANERLNVLELLQYDGNFSESLLGKSVLIILSNEYLD